MEKQLIEVNIKGYKTKLKLINTFYYLYYLNTLNKKILLNNYVNFQQKIINNM